MQTQEKARQRALCRQSVEKRRLVEEHRQREEKVRENYKQLVTGVIPYQISPFLIESMNCVFFLQTITNWSTKQGEL